MLRGSVNNNIVLCSMRSHTLNQALSSFFLLSCFLSFCKRSNSPTRAPKGGLGPLLFCGAGGKSDSSGGGDRGGVVGAGVGCMLVYINVSKQQ